MIKFQKKSEKEVIPKNIQTAMDVVNVKAIEAGILYTLDGYMCSYIKINPISIDLYSQNEKVGLKKQITAQLSQEQKAFKFIAISRPVDITQLVNNYMDIINESAVGIQKELLKKEIEVISDYSTSGEVVERQFYLMIWDKTTSDINDFKKRAIDLANRMSSGSIRAEVIPNKQIYELCNLMNNPGYVMEEEDVKKTFPTIGGIE